MNKILFVSALVFAAACGGKSGGGTDPCKDPCKDKKMAAGSCGAMAESVAGHMRAEGEMPEEQVVAFQDLFMSECSNQAWSQETIDCMTAATNAEEGEACQSSTMSQEQSDSLDAAFASAGGGGEGMEDEGMEGDGMDEGME